VIPVSDSALINVIEGFDSDVCALVIVSLTHANSSICRYSSSEHTVMIPTSACTTAMNVVAFRQQSEAVSHGLSSHNSQLQG